MSFATASCVIIVISAALADDLERENSMLEAGNALRRVLDDQGAAALPGRTPAVDEDGFAYVTISVPDGVDAQGLADVLGKIQGVKAAYVKPAEALP